MHNISSSIRDANAAVIILKPDRIPPVMPRFLVSTRSVHAPTIGPTGMNIGKQLLKTESSNRVPHDTAIALVQS